MTITVMASNGQDPGSLVAVDNFIIKMVTNATAATATNKKNATAEPETDIKEKVRLLRRVF